MGLQLKLESMSTQETNKKSEQKSPWNPINKSDSASFAAVNSARLSMSIWCLRAHSHCLRELYEHSSLLKGGLRTHSLSTGALRTQFSV